jgi:hypothetical protein
MKMSELWVACESFSSRNPIGSVVLYDGKERQVLSEAYLIIKQPVVQLSKVNNPVPLSEIQQYDDSRTTP